MVRIEETFKVSRPGTKSFLVYFGHDDAEENPGLPVEFEVDEKYELLYPLGCGTFGGVVAARDKSTGLEVAIKKMVQITSDYFLGQRAIRELQILHDLSHPFLIDLKSVIVPTDRKHFTHLYIVMEKMQSNLRAYIKQRSEEAGTGESGRMPNFHIKLIMNQLLRGMQYLLSANVLHRDMKPENVLITDLRVKISDFGGSRQESKDEEMTRSVCTPSYTPPEFFLNHDSGEYIKYGASMDMWSLGCLFADLLHPRREEYSFFQIDSSHGTELINLRQIASKIPVPTDEAELASFIDSEDMREFVKEKLPHTPSEPLRQIFGDVEDKSAVDLLEKMLVFNPRKRISVEEALKHEYMADVSVDVLERELDLDSDEVEKVRNQNPPDFVIDEDKIECAKMHELTQMLYELSLSFGVGSRTDSNLGIKIEEVEDEGNTVEEVDDEGITIAEVEDE